MIPAAKSRWFTRWFASQAQARLRARFGAIHIADLAVLAQALERAPVLVVSNHSSWWDPIVLLVLTQLHLPRADAYAMMESANLQRLPFFAKVGAFGVDRSSRRDGAEATRYAVSLLDRPGRLVWVFAQGEERPLHERPLRFMGGAARVALRAPAAEVVPLAFAYGFGPVESPEVFVSVGAPLPAERSSAQTRAAQARAVQHQMERIEREQSERGSQGFVTHPLQRNSWFGGVAERMLATLARPFVPGLVQTPAEDLAQLEQPAGTEPQRSLAPAHSGRAEGGADERSC
ncbi:MAG: lysophospholipid acyltransferase family protein [Nannocystaceae bacterium]